MSSLDRASSFIENLNPDELEEDLAMMIDILTIQRGVKHNISPDDKDYEISAAILCAALQPLKPPGYRKQAKFARTIFRGIAENRHKQALFKACINDAALELTNPAALRTANYTSLIKIPMQNGMSELND